MRNALFALACAALAGCYDNSGGEPPDGEELADTLQIGGLQCDFLEEGARMVSSRAEFDALLAEREGCGNIEIDRALLEPTVDGLTDDQRLVFLTVSVGGCVSRYDIEGFFLDGEQVNAWVLRGDRSFNDGSYSCDTLQLLSTEAWRLGDVAPADVSELHIGDYNPRRADAPYPEPPPTPSLPG